MAHSGQAVAHQIVPDSVRSFVCLPEVDWEVTGFARVPLISSSTPQEFSSLLLVVTADLRTIEELASLEDLSVGRRKLCL